MSQPVERQLSSRPVERQLSSRPVERQLSSRQVERQLSTQPVSQQLSTQSVGRQLSRDKLPWHLRRAVEMPTVLSCCGRHWRSSVGTEDDFNLSSEVGSIDYFLSHDWGSSPTLKFCALVLIFDAGPAAVAAMIAGVSVGCLEAARWVPVREVKMVIGGEGFWVGLGIWSYICGVVAHVVVLVFWQRLRCLFAKRPLTAFLDKLCIHQTDMEMKSAGILGLAGFLTDTKVMAILWSPRYFSRLWCMFEVASWFLREKLGQRRANIFMPLHLAGVLVYMTLYIHTFNLLLTVFGEQFYHVPMLGAVDILSEWLLMLHSQKLMRDLRELPRQVREFSIDAAQCGCCNLGHRLPDGTEIPCDRELILESLGGWMAQGASSGTDLSTTALSELLSERISEHFTPLASLRTGAVVPYSLALKTWAVPYGLLHLANMIPAFWDIPSTVARLRALGGSACQVFCHAPCMVRVFLLVASLCESSCRRWRLVEIALAAAKMLLFFIFNNVYFTLQHESMREESPWQQVALCVFMVTLTVVLFRPRSVRSHQMISSASSNIMREPSGIELA